MHCAECKSKSIVIPIIKCPFGVSHTTSWKWKRLGKNLDGLLMKAILDFIQSNNIGTEFSTIECLTNLKISHVTDGDKMRSYLDMLVCYDVLDKIRSGGTIEQGKLNKYKIKQLDLPKKATCEFAENITHKNQATFICNFDFENDRDRRIILHKSKPVNPNIENEEEEKSD